jgi:hypothetical protein
LFDFVSLRSVSFRFYFVSQFTGTRDVLMNINFFS